MWCYEQAPAGGPTRILTEHGWLDAWDNDDVALQTLNDGDYGYRVFENFIAAPGRFMSRGFINSDHWMIDLVDLSPDRLSGGVLVSPDRTFLFVDGKLVAEFDAAATSGMSGANRFYEIDVSPALEPTDRTVDALYGYGAFGYVGAVGCRLESGRNFVCAMYDDSGRATDGRCVGPEVCRDGGAVGSDSQPGRVWETQGTGNALVGQVIGGYPQWPIPGTNMRVQDVWRSCAANEHDLHCRDRFRMEVSRDRVDLYVNGYEAMHMLLTATNPEGRDSRIPESWFDSGVRVYLTSWVNGGQHTPTRWHWNEVRINPEGPRTTSPSFCLGVLAPLNTCPHNHTPGEREVPAPHVTPSPTLEPTSTPTTVPTTTPTATSTPLPQATPTPTAGPETQTYTCAVLVTTVSEDVALSAQECTRVP